MAERRRGTDCCETEARRSAKEGRSGRPLQRPWSVLGNNGNAIRLQICAAMIAYALLRIAARRHCVTISILRFTDLVALCLFARRHLGAIEKPPPVNPSRRRCPSAEHQLSLSYA